jgi:hypothetical protein
MSLATDTYGASLLDLLGVGNVFADSLDRYPEVTLTEVAARAPSVILLPSEPYVFSDDHVAEPRRGGAPVVKEAWTCRCAVAVIAAGSLDRRRKRTGV